jgi:hypothetical protein
MHQHGSIIQTDKLVQFLGILVRDAIFASDGHLHVVHSETLHDSGLIESAILALGTNIDNRNVAVFGKNLECSLIRLTCRRDAINGLYPTQLDNLCFVIVIAL